MTNLQSGMTHELSSTEAHPFEGRAPGPGAARAMAVRPDEITGHVMSKEIDLVQCLHEQLATFRAYSEYLGQAPQVVSVSFQCLVDGQDVDSQHKEVAEVLGVVAL